MAAQSACSDVIACTAGCGCNDLSCLQSCSGKLTDACETASDAIGQCEDSECAGECTTTGGGGAGGSSSSGTAEGCDESLTNQQCTEVQLPGGLGKAEMDKSCTDAGGTPIDKCPSTNLVGCCSYAAGLTTQCVYTGAEATLDEAGCVQSGGAWSPTH